MGTNLVHDALEKVNRSGFIQQSMQMGYVDRKARNVAFMLGERILLRGSIHEGCDEVRKEGLSGVHPVFRVSMLRMYYEDPSHVLDFSSVQLDKNLTYDEEQVAILDSQVRKLRLKDIASMKVQWRGKPVEEATWETKHNLWSRYPHLSDIPGMILDPFEDEQWF
ncbi:uncharacterized protein [Nicotiana tomentosiformis]|uniref:uncharacterized protein n=1 Tax=Nicotiana tomentosiformis TaxID=4098 RepID=UPI00388C810F